MHPKQAIFKAIEEVFGIDKTQLKSRSRTADIIDAKKAFCYVLYNNGVFKVSHESIGKILNTDRTTIIHHLVTAKGFIETDKNFADIVQRVTDLFIKYSGQYKVEDIEIKVAKVIERSNALNEAVQDLISSYTDLKLELKQNFKDELK